MKLQDVQALVCLSCLTSAYARVLSERALPTQSLPITTIYSSSVPITQKASATGPPATIGSVHTVLETAGRSSALPFTSTVVSITASIKIPFDSSISLESARPTAALIANIFAAPIATNAPPAQIPRKDNHPAKKTGIKPQTMPLQTNKFYANFFLGNQNYATFTHPYSLTWSKGGGQTGSWGMAISHIERNQLAYGPGNPPQYYINPLGIQSMILSATELGPSTVLRTDTHQAFSVNAILAPSSSADALISFPVVQGTGFITGLYNGATPLIQSGVQFRKLTYVGRVSKATSTYKYRVLLEDNSNWLLYMTPNGAIGNPPMKLLNSKSIQGPKNFHGTVQVAKNPAGASGEQSYDASAGTYAVGTALSAAVNRKIASYALFWDKGGNKNQQVLMFALPHQIESLSEESKKRLTQVQLQTTTKGMATAILADSMTMVEPDLPTDIDFAPYNPQPRNAKFVSNTAINSINQASGHELSEDIDAQSNLDSMYFSGKALSKFASIVYATQTMGANSSLAVAGLNKLKKSFSRFVNNQQKFPLVFDTTWRGVVSSASYTTGDSGVDFGNSYYNDHHFHYGYFVHAASIIARLDPTWLQQGTNKAWVNMLVRDFANSVSSDQYFPFSRSFDWYHGHSWAKGLFDSPDGKDQESTSEDAFAAYAVKLWGKAIGDPNMEARANLQLAVLARSLRNYFLLDSDNKNQPPSFVPNRVTGILFENKVDHTTYFGQQTQYIQGIHMIPISPISSYMRSKTFVSQEWQQYFANGFCNTLTDGWRGLLMANYAMIDPKGSFNFFNDRNFNYAWLDGGASRTWYLAYAAGLGGAP